jgi:hypothetical protein
VLLLALCALPRALHGQNDTTIYSAPAPGWATQISLAGANALLSAVSAGLAQELRGGSFRDGFTRGALGGLLIYGGKRVAVQDFGGAGLLGRQLGSVGGSIVRNASDGLGTFDRVVLPVGVTRVYWDRTAPQRWQVKVDALALGWTIYGIVEPELELNIERSFSAGTPVFQTQDKIIELEQSGHAGGTVQSGVVFLSNVRAWGDPFLQKAFAHERVHMMQMDQIFLSWNEPQDDRALRLIPGGAHVARWVDINLSTQLLRFLARFIDEYRERPWELEAIYFTR